MSYDDSGLPNCPMGGKCEGDCEPGCRSDSWMEELHQEAVAENCPHCGTGAGTPTCACSDPYYYSCGANYCDDPACIMNRPDHPEYYGPHPEVL